MASASSIQSEDQFLCCICLNVFGDPVTIPCGHNFCKSCITQHWDTSLHWRCPLCSLVFFRKPELKVNTVLSELADQLKKSAEVTDSRHLHQQYAKPAEVFCDYCTETKVKAEKSCLVCVASYCEEHLKHHKRVPSLRKHSLINPVNNVEDRMCVSHNRPLEMFCKIEEVCVCQLCTESDHKFHLTVPLEEEYEEKKAQLGQKEAEVQQKIQERQLKICEIQHSVKLSKEDADRQIADGVNICTTLKLSIERSQANFISTVQDQQESMERLAEGFIKELKQEMEELTRRSSELEKLSHTQDPFHLLTSLPPPISCYTKDWTKVNVYQTSYGSVVSRSLDQLANRLNLVMQELHDAELKQVQQQAVDVTLDPETANPRLVLSRDRKQVSHRDEKKLLPENRERFSLCIIVLGKQSFSSGRFYYEVEVKGKTSWDIGVARESIDRKGVSTLSPKSGLWSIYLINTDTVAVADPPLRLCLRKKLQKVGVFVDYDKGLVSFYDVENRLHIYSFTGCNFTERLYACFNPGFNDGGKNSAPLIITPVVKQD